MSEEAPRGRGALEAALSHAPVGVLVFDAHGRFLYGNQEASRLLGVPLDSSSPQPFPPVWRFFDPRGQPVLTESLPHRRTLATTEPSCAELVLRRSDGSRQIYLCSASPLWTGGELAGVAAYFTDVTAQRRAEETFESFIERNPHAIALHRDGKILHMNPAGLRLLGYDRLEEVVGKLNLSLVHPDDRAQAQARIDAMLERRQPLPVQEERFLRRDGTAVVTRAFSMPVTYRGRDTLMVMAQDLSERRQLQGELSALRDRAQQGAAELHAILDSLTGGVLVCDLQERLTLANPSAARLLGSTEEELAGAPLAEVLARLQLRTRAGRALAYAEYPLPRALRGQVVDQELSLARDPSGRDVYLRISASPVHGADGRVAAAVAVCRDVTELEEVDQLKDQFIQVVAHELRTPVTIMKGYAQVLLATPGQESLRRTVEGINRGADRIDRIVSDLLRIEQLLLGRLELSLDRVDLRELVEARVTQLAPALRRNPLHLVEAQPALVQADRERLEQVLTTLVDNAARYSPDGGEVEVTLTVELRSAVVSVRDHGVGIPQAKQGRIFQRFYRAHTGTPYDYGGMGVGLFIARELIRRHGGRIWFESEEGRGSTFHFSVPLVGAPQAEAHQVTM